MSKNKLEVEYLPIEGVRPYENNPRRNDKAVDIVKKSISEFGFRNPIIVDKDNEIIAGHTRIKAAKELEMEKIPVLRVEDLTDAQVKAFRIMDNKSQEYAEWDEELLKEEFDELRNSDLDLELTGFEEEEYKELTKEELKEKAELLAKDILIIPAFSVFDGRSGKWINRTRKWREIVPIEECVETREGTLADPNNMYGQYRSVSVFNHTLAEVLTRGFSKEGDKVVIPFAEASITAVTSILNREVLGIELREEQVKINNKLIDKFDSEDSKVIKGDALDEKNYEEADFIMSCPPYIGLEKYSELDEDLSNMGQSEYFKSMEEFLEICYKKLKEGRFMALVLGNIRAKNGRVIDISGEVRRLAEKKGFNFYNDIVFLQPMASTALRQGQFTKSRKVVRCHEKVLILKKGGKEKINNPITKEHELNNKEILILYKGDPKNAKENANRMNEKTKIAELEEFGNFGEEIQ